jgi:peroxiredoxin
MVPLGTTAPEFNLLDTITDVNKSLSELKSDVATVIMFICNHCPYVKHINMELSKTANEYISKGISFIGISSNDINNYPEDSPAKMKELAIEVGYPFPYLFDESQDIARAYDAACTPDFYIFDKNMKLVYRGQFDDSRPNNDKPVTGKDIKDALDSLISSKPVNPNQTPSIGCNIKWKT